VRGEEEGKRLQKTWKFAGSAGSPAATHGTKQAIDLLSRELREPHKIFVLSFSCVFTVIKPQNTEVSLISHIKNTFERK